MRSAIAGNMKEPAAKFVEWLTTDNDTCQKTYDIMHNLPCNIKVLEGIESDPDPSILGLIPHSLNVFP